MSKIVNSFVLMILLMFNFLWSSTGLSEVCLKNTINRGVGVTPKYCKDGYKQDDDGFFCYKQTDSGKSLRTPHLPTKCNPAKEKDAGLCYDKCAEGYTGVGPICWQKCPAGKVDCGTTCVSSGKACAADVGKKVGSVLELTGKVLALVGTAGISAGADVGAQVAISLATEAAQSLASQLLQEIPLVAGELIATKKAEERIQEAYPQLNKEVVSILAGIMVNKTTNKERALKFVKSLDPTAISSIVSTFKQEMCTAP